MDATTAAGLGSNLDDGFYVGDLWVVPDRGVIIDAGTAVRIEPKVMAVLVCLAHRPGAVVPHDDLLAAGWGADGATGDLLSRAVGRLRRVLSRGTGRPTIESVRGRGYCLVSDVSRSAPAESRRAAARGARRRRVSPLAASGLSFAASVFVWLLACVL